VPRPLPRTPTSVQLLAAHSALVYLFLYAPILVLVFLSFNRSSQVGIWRGFSVKWYRVLFADQAMRDAAINSLIVASVTTGVATSIGTFAALALSRYRFSGRIGIAATSATSGLLYLPVIIPEVVLGVALLTSDRLLRVQLSLVTVIVAHIVFSVSYVAIVVKARLAGLDRSLEEAAMDLGAGPVATFVRITLPLIAPGVIAAALLVFTISLDDYVVTSFVSGPQSTTLPVLIFSLLHTRVPPEVNAVCTVLLGLTITMVVISQWLLRERADG
jgi:spermidine/putrescine transport system permease protein